MNKEEWSGVPKSVEPVVLTVFRRGPVEVEGNYES